MFQFSLSGMNQMIKFNFEVKVGFVAVVMNETAIGTKVRHRNNGMYWGWIKAYLKNGKLLIAVEDEEGVLINQQVDPEKFMVKDRNHNNMINYVCERISHIMAEIDSSVDRCDFDDYNLYKDKYELLRSYLGVIIYSLDEKLKKNADLTQY
jgi:hypothetical protein